MRAIVVYESHWGNTAAVARAIAEGLGPDARAMSTDEAVGPAVANANTRRRRSTGDLHSDFRERECASRSQGCKAPTPPDVSHHSCARG